jgi:hypothetical protein
VKARIEKAKVLEDEAREVYEKARSEVEEMVMGESYKEIKTM